MNKTLWYITIILLSAGILLAIFAPLPHLKKALFSLGNNTHTISHTDNTTHITHPDNNSGSQSNNGTATTKDTLLNSNDTNPDPLVYRNEEFGFQISLPPGREDNKIEISKDGSTDMYSVIFSLFIYNNQERGTRPNEIIIQDKYVPLIFINIFTPEAYKNHNYDYCMTFFGEESCTNASYLGHNNNFHFLLEGGNRTTIGGDNCCTDRSIFDYIQQNFQIIEKLPTDT